MHTSPSRRGLTRRAAAALAASTALLAVVPLAAAATPGTAAASSAPEPGDPAAPAGGAPLATDRSTDGVIAREGFDGGLPEGWRVAGEGWHATDRAEWTAEADEMRGRFARPLAGFLAADAAQQAGALDTTVTSAPFDVAGTGAVRLTFDSHYRGAPGQAGVVAVSFDGSAPEEILTLDEATVENGYDAAQLNAAQDVVIDVPDGAKEARFSWRFSSGDDARYWAIDSVALHDVQREAVGEPTQAWVMSDIQGDPGDWQHAIGDAAALAPGADAMLLDGDIVANGTAAEWAEIDEVMAATADIRPRQTVAAIGNHERYAPGGFEANRDRFLAFAERDRVWDEYVIEGPGGDLPVIVLGQEFEGPSDVAMSDAQVEFLEERLAHWSAQDSQVVVMTHFPLGDTVSASWIPGYHDHHQMNDRLTRILGDHPNAIVLTGHTHYSADHGDWAVQRRTEGGHPDGFRAVNTVAIQTGWEAVGEDTATIREVTTSDVNVGLTLASYGDRVVIEARDFDTDERLREVTIPNPLTPFERDDEEAPEAPAWQEGAVYTAGDTVAHDGAVYVAQWWTTEEPGASTTGSWMERGELVACGAGDIRAWTASQVYTGGEQVVHDGRIFEAKWWTRDERPGAQWGPWEDAGAC